MSKAVIPDEQIATGASGNSELALDRALVEEELHKILSSRHFQTSRRSKEFLEYVVVQKISGHGDLLKERLIGVHLFGRKPDYSTGDDPVVRVQAGDVRHRLERYYADPDLPSDLLIQIPVGSYAPVFSRRSSQLRKNAILGGASGLANAGLEQHDAGDVVAPHKVSDSAGKDPAEPMSDGSRSEHSFAPLGKPFEGEVVAGAVSFPGRTFWKTLARPRIFVLALTCLLLIAFVFAFLHHKQSELTAEAFWFPASRSSKPVLLCLPKPMVYRPGNQLFERSEKAHSSAPPSREARRDQVLPLDPAETIRWGDMTPVRSSGPGIGGVVAAVNVTKQLTEQGISFELRFGGEATYVEMRNSPVVLIGGINTDWATQLTSEFPFVFDETIEAPNIHETGGRKRVWTMEGSGSHITRDYGLITRQLSGKAGQFFVQVAGVSHFGTEAASEALLRQQELASALRSKGIDFRAKNLQIVVSTDITNDRSGPPHIVAITSW